MKEFLNITFSRHLKAYILYGGIARPPELLKR